MELKLTNSLTRNKEEFTPLHQGKVGLYVCGPTVYNTASIGNFRAYIFSDLLRRVLEFDGYEVKQVMNITDVGHLTDDADSGEDKMIQAMRREGRSALEIAEMYTTQFMQDLERLNILRPQVMPKATEHIEDQIELIKAIEEKGFTYKTSDGIYFDTSKLPSYGELTGQKLEEKEAGARVEVNEEKKNPTDFALWKFSPKDEKREMEWESPWGKGFPGWHIECSAMSEKYLDSPFDIHTGGEDHLSVHHPNEIAQTEAARGNKLANYWLHVAFLQVNGGKMSKSLGNTYSLDDLLEKGFEPLAYRYFVLGAHYRSPLNFTWEALKAAQSALHHLEDKARHWLEPTEPEAVALERFTKKINDDLDTPGALAELWKVVNDENLDSAIKSATVLEFDRVLGLSLDKIVAQPLQIPMQVQKMIKDRAEAREMKDWARADELRDEIKNAGFEVEDTPEGQRLRKFHV